MKIGEKLKELRLKKNLSFSQLGDEVGLTKSFLWQIEKEKSSPSITTLMKILAFYNIKTADFFQSIEKSDEFFLKKDDRQYYHDKESNIRTASLSTGFLNPSMQPFYAEVDSGSVSEIVIGQGQVFCYIMTGSAELQINEKQYILKSGDSIYFNASTPHSWKVLGKTKLTGLWVADEEGFKII
jgi:transcriptional regulator with XRE-family HTH domain